MLALLNSALRTPCGGFHRAGIFHHQSGGFTPRNSFSARLLAKNDRIGRARLDLLKHGHVIPLGLSSEFRIPSSEFGNARCSMHHACYFTGACPVEFFLRLPFS